jgi:hypothetical protein
MQICETFVAEVCRMLKVIQRFAKGCNCCLQGEYRFCHLLNFVIDLSVKCF